MKQDSSSSDADLSKYLGVFRYTRRAIELVWATDRALLLGIGLLTLFAGLMPALVAWIGKHIVDAVVAASQGTALVQTVMFWVLLEGAVVAARAVAQRGLAISEQLLRAKLGFRVNTMILEKALTLSMAAFEDSAFYDRMTRARREASRRPLSLVRRTFGLMQDALTLITYGGLLVAFSPWVVLVLIVAAIPSFVAETRFSAEAFRLFSWRATETRKQHYLESVLAREDYAKEVKLFGLGPTLLGRYRQIFDELYEEDRDLTIRRGFWGTTLGFLGTAAFYGTYAWIALEASAGRISLGEMTMYLLVFKQGQATIAAALTSIGGMYEDNLYLSNLYGFLDDATPERCGGVRVGSSPGDGVRFDGVWFSYPGSETPALRGIDLHIKPGETVALVGENGSGKTTLIKLMSGFYQPDEGVVRVDGTAVEDWDLDALRARIGVIFQDFVRYQLPVGENIGVGDVRHLEAREQWSEAARKGLAEPFIEAMESGYDTQLGRWFPGGRELSLGQWQKVALSRAFMRREADILVLDEPTAAMDAEAEYTIFERFRELTDGRIAVLISHRFSTVRMADHIAVLHQGELVELGDHDTLMAVQGQYARLFTLQAKGYR